MTTRLWTILVLGLLAVAPSVSSQAPPAEWFQWRGPDRDGISRRNRAAAGLAEGRAAAGLAATGRGQRLLVVVRRLADASTRSARAAATST